MVDIPGNGFYRDATGASIFDSWLTFGSGGFDLEALGVISRKMTYPEWAAQKNLTNADDLADSDRDGLVNLLEYAFGRSPGQNDSAMPVSTSTFASGRVTIHFTRDERAMDLIYLVQASGDLRSWTTIARSENGQPFTGAEGFSPAIVEQSASAVLSVQVLRSVHISDVMIGAGARWMRVVVTR